ncbi:unnamed protein product, partial [Strongylus vulgaris]
MLRKPVRSRSGRLRADGDAINRGPSRAILRVASRSRTRANTAPLATPEEDCRR